MKVQTNITETVEQVQVQVIKEIKKHKATVTLEVDQDFVDLMNFFGNVTQSDFIQMGGTNEQYQIIATLWNKIHNNTELRNVLNFDYQRGFTMKQQVQSEQ